MAEWRQLYGAWLIVLLCLSGPEGGSGMEQDHSEHSWVWFCSHREVVDELCRVFPDVFLSPHPFSSVSSLGLLFSDVSLARVMCPAVMEGTAARAEHPCNEVRWSQWGSVPLDPLHPSSAQLLRVGFSTVPVTTSLPRGKRKRECVGTWQNTEMMDVAVQMMFWLLSQKGLMAEMGK